MKENKLFNQKTVEFVKKQAKNVLSIAVVASVATLGRNGTPRIEGYPKDYFKTIVIDEAHHAAAPSYRRVIDYFNPPFLLGVTATPQRSDSVRLVDVFDEIVYYKSIQDLIEDGWLSPLIGYRVKTNVDISDVEIQNGDYITSSLIAGYGSLQNDDILHSYTVAKCTETIDWSAVNQTIVYNGNTYKIYLTGCTYHCG